MDENAPASSRNVDGHSSQAQLGTPVRVYCNGELVADSAWARLPDPYIMVLSSPSASNSSVMIENMFSYNSDMTEPTTAGNRLLFTSQYRWRNGKLFALC
jgi:hypothetical protein